MRRHVDDDDSVPVPTRLTDTVAVVPQPADNVLLPLSPGAAPTIVRAGALPVPVQVKLTDMWLLSTMLKPVTETFPTLLSALKLSRVPVLLGPYRP